MGFFSHRILLADCQELINIYLLYKTQNTNQILITYSFLSNGEFSMYKILTIFQKGTGSIFQHFKFLQIQKYKHANSKIVQKMLSYKFIHDHLLPSVQSS